MKLQNVMYGLLGMILIEGTLAMENDSSSEGDFLNKAMCDSRIHDEPKFTQEQIRTFKIVGCVESEENLKTHRSAKFCINRPTLLQLITNNHFPDEDRLNQIEYFETHKAFCAICSLEQRQQTDFPHSMYRVTVLLQLYGASLEEIASILELEQGIMNQIRIVIYNTYEYRLEQLQKKQQRRREKNQTHADGS